MLNKTERTFTIIFALIVAIELLTGNVESLSQYHYVAKPAIVLSLIVFIIFGNSLPSSKTKSLIILALVFSVIGDSLLLFVDRSLHYFTTGLVAFLLAHIVYIIVFLKHRNPNRKFLGFGFGLLIYALGLFYLLKDGLGSMLLPVLLYMLVILSMVISTYLRKGVVLKTSYILVFIGALFFMLSDSILATNKFYQPLPYSGITIMITYAIAQYLIVLGILKQLQNSVTS